MDGTYVVQIDDQPNALRAELAAGLKRFNEGIAGPYNDEPLSLSIRDGGTLIGGLTGLFFWNMLHVHFLWVAENQRHRGHGAALLGRAEQIAIERGCEVVFLDTFGFQAPGFYLKLRYEAFGKLPDGPKGFGTTWFAKRLAH